MAEKLDVKISFVNLMLLIIFGQLELHLIFQLREVPASCKERKNYKTNKSN